MARNFYYTDRIVADDSTAIDILWYNDDLRQVFVRFRSTGSIAGYGEFAPAYWDALKRAKQEGRSLGNFVATRIKGSFPGVDGDIIPVPSAEYLSNRKSFQSGPTEVTEVTDSKDKFTVKFVATVSGTFAIDARSVDDALAQFAQVHNPLDYLDDEWKGSVNVTEVTQHFSK